MDHPVGPTVVSEPANGLGREKTAAAVGNQVLSIGWR